MSDIVRRLHDGIQLYSAVMEDSDKHMGLLADAADEVEITGVRLRAELAEARKAALEEAARVCDKERDFLQKDGSGPFTFGGAYAAAKLAAAIRKRGESDD